MHADSSPRLDEIFAAVAREHGVDIYALDVRKINPRPSVRLKCLVPLCEYYGVCKVCPPHIPGVAEFREALGDYRQAYLVVLRERIKNIADYQTDFSAELRLAEAVAALEQAAFEQDCCQAMGLCVGGCKLCSACAPPDEPCRHPFKARPSPEGFGIDITGLAREAGVPVEWPPAEYVNFLGLVLV